MGNSLQAVKSFNFNLICSKTKIIKFILLIIGFPSILTCVKTYEKYLSIQTIYDLESLNDDKDSMKSMSG